MPYSIKKYKSKKKYHAYKRCVKKVGEKDGFVNKYAVCRSSVYGKKKQTGFADLGHYDWEEEKKMTKKQKRESGWN